MIRKLMDTEIDSVWNDIANMLSSDKAHFWNSALREGILKQAEKYKSSFSYLVEEQDSTICSVLVYDENKAVRFLLTDPKCRKKGYATGLLDSLVEMANQDHLARIKITAIGELVVFCKDYGFDISGEEIKENLELAEMEYVLGTEWLGKTVTVTIERPYGSFDLRHEGISEMNSGYVKEDISFEDHDFLDAYVFGLEEPLESFTGVVVAVIYRKEAANIRLVVARSGETIQHEAVIQKLGYTEQYYDIRILWADEQKKMN